MHGPEAYLRGGGASPCLATEEAAALLAQLALLAKTPSFSAATDEAAALLVQAALLVEAALPGSAVLAMAAGHGHWLWPLAMPTGHGHWPWPLAMAAGHGHGHGQGPWIWPWSLAMANCHGNRPWPLAMAMAMAAGHGLRHFLVPDLLQSAVHSPPAFLSAWPRKLAFLP